jgi:hypothetical protein
MVLGGYIPLSFTLTPTLLYTTLCSAAHHSRWPGSRRWLSIETLRYIIPYFHQQQKMPELPNRDLWNFRTRTSCTSGLESSELLDQNLWNFRTRGSGTSGLEPLELPDQKLRNFQTRSSGTFGPEAPELPDQNLRNFWTRSSGTSRLETPEIPELPDRNLWSFQTGRFIFLKRIKKKKRFNIILIILIDNSLVITYWKVFKKKKDNYIRKLLTAQVNAVLNKQGDRLIPRCEGIAT